jgi:hypothetical protein
MNCPYNHNDPESRFVWLEEKLETVKLERDMLEHKAWDLEKYLTKKLEELKLERDALWVKTQEDEREINQLRDAAEELEEVKLERDALWVKTQEDEREINDLRDINKQLRERLTNYLEAFVRFNKDIEVFKQ